MEENKIKYCLFPNEEDKICDKKCKYYNTCARKKNQAMKDFATRK